MYKEAEQYHNIFEIYFGYIYIYIINTHEI